MQVKNKTNGFRVIFLSVFIIITYEFILISQNNVIDILNYFGILKDLRFQLIFSMLYQVCSYLLVFFLIRRYIFPYKVSKYQLKNPIKIYFVTAILAYLLAAAVLSFFTFVFYLEPSESELMFEKLLKGYPWFGIISALIIAPICEEIFFRYYILNFLETQFKPRTAVILSALLFGAFHLNIRQFLFATVLGFVLGIVYNKTKDIRHSIFLHFIFNLVSFINVVVLINPSIILLAIIAVFYVSKVNFRKEELEKV